MIRAFGLAFAQLLDSRILRILLTSLIVTIAVYAVLIVSLIWSLEHISLAQTPWLDSLARWGSGLGAVLLATLLFPGAVTAMMAFRQDAIADAVEARHYPGLARARDVPLSESLGAGLRLLALTVLLNLALLPVYLALLLVPPANAVLFAAVNGLLLGREYFDAAALRRATPAETAALRRTHRRQIWLAGTVAAVALTIPFLNLIGPVLATAAFVHVFHQTRGESPRVARTG